MQYVCIEDLQGGSFAIGRKGDLEYWRESATEWATDDGDNESVNLIQVCDDNKLINVISEIWDIVIEPCA